MSKRKAAAAWRQTENVTSDNSALVEKSLASEKKFIEIKPKKDESDFDPVRKQRLDILTNHLGCTSYYMNMRWTWFGHNPFGKWLPLEVSRYYHEKKLAIDIGTNFSPTIIEIKKKLLESQGIQYYVITSATDLQQFAERTI